METTITEIMDDVEDIPEWLQETFRESRLYHRCKERVEELEAEVENWKANVGDLEGVCSELRQEEEKLRVALEKYGMR